MSKINISQNKKYACYDSRKKQGWPFPVKDNLLVKAEN
jgi:hypothetical protein